MLALIPARLLSTSSRWSGQLYDGGIYSKEGTTQHRLVRDNSRSYYGIITPLAPSALA